MGAKVSQHIRNRCDEFGTQPFVKYDLTKRRRPPKWLKDYPKGKFSEYLQPEFEFDEQTLNFLQESFIVLARASREEMARPLPQNINQLYIGNEIQETGNIGNEIQETGNIGNQNQETQNIGNEIQETQFSYNVDHRYVCSVGVPAPLPPNLPPNYGPVGLSPLVTFGLMGLGFVYSWKQGRAIPPSFPHTF